MGKKKTNQETLQFHEAPIYIEFPLYLKNEKGNLFWRYHINGKYELLSFGKNNNSFTYGENDYWRGIDNNFEKLFILKQIEINKESNEEEFILQYKKYLELHAKFLGNDIEFAKEDLITETKKHYKGKSIGGIIVKEEGEDDNPF